MLRTLAVAARDRARLAEIAQVASRFGLGVLLSRIGLGDRGDAAAADAADLPQRTRRALEALGPTFVKPGQILATRADLLPPAWIAELELLHSQAPVLAFADLRAAVEAALGEPPESAFAAFDERPLAAASMAQVHRATLQDGRAVVVKVQRPGIRGRMAADLRLIAGAAQVVEAFSAEALRFAPVAMVRQLAAAVLEELDFTAEGRNAELLAADFAANPRVVVPAIHWQWTSGTLLVMDYVDGVVPRSGEALRAAGIDPAAIAALGAGIVLDMVLINGRFHGDPHPGNLLCLAGDRIALLDLGLVGHVSARRRQEFVSFVLAIVNADPALLADVLLAWAGPDTMREPVRAMADRLVARHGGRIVLTALVTDFLTAMRDAKLTLPADLLLIFKALITIDGVLAAVEPGFDLTRAIRAAALRIAAMRIMPDHWLTVARALAWEVVKLGDDAPRLLRAAVRRLEADPAGDLGRHDLPRQDPRRQNQLGAARLVAAAIIAGALVIAAAIVLT